MWSVRSCRLLLTEARDTTARQVVLEEARESYKPEILVELMSNTADELEANAEQVISLISTECMVILLGRQVDSRMDTMTGWKHAVSDLSHCRPKFTCEMILLVTRR